MRWENAARRSATSLSFARYKPQRNSFLLQRNILYSPTLLQRIFYYSSDERGTNNKISSRNESSTPLRYMSNRSQYAKRRWVRSSNRRSKIPPSRLIDLYSKVPNTVVAFEFRWRTKIYYMLHALRRRGKYCWREADELAETNQSGHLMCTDDSKH